MRRTPEDQWEPTPEILKLYRNGEWKAPTPPVSTWAWTEEDWIRYIDKNGDWGLFLSMNKSPDELLLNTLREVLEWCIVDAANEDGYPTQEMLDNRVEVLRNALEEDTMNCTKVWRIRDQGVTLDARILWWSNAEGWTTHRPDATVFTSVERVTLNLPMGDNPQWDEEDEEDEECECGGDGCGDCMGDYEDDVRFDTCAERDDFYEEQERDHG